VTFAMLLVCINRAHRVANIQRDMFSDPGDARRRQTALISRWTQTTQTEYVSSLQS